MRIVITGAGGFVGRHLSAILHENSHYIIGAGREESCDYVDEYYQADLSQTWPSAIKDIDAIVHLAGLATVGPSFDAPQTYININSAIVTNMCEALLTTNDHPRLIVVSSGSVYDPHQALPITENGIVSLSSPYSVSKILVENQAEYYRNRGLDCVVVRPFNHIGSGQLNGFLLPDLYEKIVDAEQDAIIRVGNITTKRDYTDVRDIVRAYAMLATSDTLAHTVYNLCSGVSHSGEEIFQTLRGVLGREDVQYSIDKTLLRPTDPQDIVGDSSRLKNELGWAPEIGLDKTIADFVAAKQALAAL